MSVRIARILVLAVLGASLCSPALAKAATPHGKTVHHKKAAAPKGPLLIWRGDVTSARGVVTDVASAWEKAGHGHVEVQSFNTASGLDAVGGGLADLAGTARDSDGSAAESQLVFTPVAWDALVIVTHPANPVSNLTLKQVHDVYYGKITNWNQLGGADAPIDVYAVASPGDGVEYSLRRLLFGRGSQPVAAPRLYVNTAKLEEAVTLDPHAFGVTTLAGVSGNRKLKMFSLDGVTPNVANIADGSYPLYTPVYLVTNPLGAKAAEARTFVDFMQSEDGKAVLRKHAILPYADAPALPDLGEARRSRILAEVGARPLPIDGTPLAAPGATYAARAAVAPGSPLTAQAQQALEARRADAALATAPATAAAAPTKPATASNASASMHPSARTYTVAKGDTLGLIARKNAVEIAQLREWNHLKGDTIRLGQVLHVSAD
jgi:phosphate transport system substrate-binding protein